MTKMETKRLFQRDIYTKSVDAMASSVYPDQTALLLHCFAQTCLYRFLFSLQ